MIGALLRSCSSASELPAKDVSRGVLVGQGEGTSGLDRVLIDCDCVLEWLNYPHKIIQALFITIRCYKDLWFVVMCAYMLWISNIMMLYILYVVSWNHVIPGLFYCNSNMRLGYVVYFFATSYLFIR